MRQEQCQPKPRSLKREAVNTRRNIIDLPHNLLAQMLCDATEEAFGDERIRFDWMVFGCDCCPARETCSPGHNGYEDWIKKWLDEYMKENTK